MALANHAPMRRDKGPKCSVALLLLDMTDEDRATLTTWLADPHIPATGIADALRAEYETDVSHHTIQRHRRGDCKC